MVLSRVGFGDQERVTSTLRVGRRMTGDIIGNPRGENNSERYSRLRRQFVAKIWLLQARFRKLAK